MKNVTLTPMPFLAASPRKVDAKKSLTPGLRDRRKQPSGNAPYFNAVFVLFNIAFLLTLFLLLPAVGTVSSHPAAATHSAPASPDPAYSPLSAYLSKQSGAVRITTPTRAWIWTRPAGNRRKSFVIKMNLPVRPFD